MLRLCEKEFANPEGLKVVVGEEYICLNQGVWQERTNMLSQPSV